ncbi:hypothetical protein DOTSEDRAFT_66216 [Dothistroma septosporum NZE10]|uniref:ARM repeat-containing protein n=1 Tax=Dothistroma septosporum (strain NZE10 / CBS 128990) TaxID=675120 RepID=M2YJN4_DOTSN|nr:hypothetical protein DOTSEDRAFT_66216 [Dothistroma septosporum NZE10]
MPMCDSSAEQRELALVGKVEMRIALTDTDTKLEAMLKTYLAPLLLKLASEHQSVRTRVIAICQHVNTRIAPQSIQLPVAALIKQFKEQDSSLIRHFDLLYIQQGVVRLTNAAKADLLPVVVSGIAKSGSHGHQIFYLLLRLLESITLPLRGSKEDLEMRTKLEVSDDDARFLSEHLGKLLLFTLQKGATKTCPGLTSDDYSFFTLQGKEDAWVPSAGGLNLTRTKTLAAKLLASGLFKDEERFLPALYASSDAASPISDVGDDMMKRTLPVTDLEDENLIKELFDLYFGSGAASRVGAPLRLKILNLLNRSTRSTTFANNIVRLADDGVMSTGTGREATKLRSAVFAYINFVARFGPQETLYSIAAKVVNRLRDFVENQGWPKAGSSEDLVSRGYAYEVIGLLAKAGPKSLLVEDEHASFDLLRWLFESLAKDSSGNAVTVSIEETLSTVLGAFAKLKLEASEQGALEDLLVDQMIKSGDVEDKTRFRSTRYITVRFANRCLPYSSTKARWVDVLAMGASSDRVEVREEGERGLSPYWYRMLNGTSAGTDINVDFPAFEAVIEQFFVNQSRTTGTDTTALVQRCQKAFESSFAAMTAYARRVLLQHALLKTDIPVNIDNDWERRLDALAESDIAARSAISKHTESIFATSPDSINILLCCLFECVLAKTTGIEAHLVEFLALSPEGLIADHASRVSSLQPSSNGRFRLLPALKSTSYRKRMSAAQAFGILASLPSRDPNADIVELLGVVRSWASAVGASLSHVHGALVALAYLFSRQSYRSGKIPDSEAYQDFLKVTFEIFNDARDDLLREACYVAIGQMCLFNCLQATSLETFSSPKAVIDKLYEKAKDGNEAAILCIGEVSMILLEGSDELSHVEDQLHKLHEIRQSEVHFTVGEAFSYVALGWKSSALATKLDINVENPPTLGQPRSTTLTKLLDRTLKDCANTKPALKKAAVMWLLCLVQFCGEQLQSRLSECQTAFRRCLSDRDELVQETASRGLGLVYEKGDRSLKDDLVRELVSSFSSDKQQLAGNVSEDTQLFEPGALPTGDGSVSTYKDIMSLAAEVGDSSLVYKFMSMASSNAIWSSRAAFGRFGLSRVLSDSSVDGYLANNPKLYPKLYRYRFDPNGGVQRSMNEIWNALVPDNTATIDKHFDAIMEDLLTSILGKEWRVRQACCAAIADLVQGRTLEKYEGYLERIWTQCFKVLDDIKESVRAAAASLARTLTGVLTRALEADHSSTKNASAMLKHVLPFLLSPSGMESSAKEVQAFSVHTLLEIIKKANGATLRPFIPELIERLIGLLSSLEPEAVNYIHLNASKYNLTEQKIDDMRLSSVRTSPLMEAIERCLDLLDEDTMKALWPKLESAMKSAVGLPSKVGASRVLVSLGTRRMVLFKAYADDALRLIEKLVVDRNETVASSYAIAAGYIARGASDKQILRLVAFTKKLYFDSEGDREGTVPRRSITSGEILHAFAKYASDRFNEFATSTLPFVFVGKHDSHEQVKEQFQETWNEAVGGSRAVLLYLTEILELCVAHLDSPQWTLKHTAARSIADATLAASTNESQLSAATASKLWPAIEKALGGKTWDGKEDVLWAFVKFVEVGGSFYAEHENVRSAIVKIALREAKRQNADYRAHSVKALGRIAKARSDIDMSDGVFDVVDPLLMPESDEDKMEIDSGKEQVRKAEELKDSTISAAIEAVLASINPSVAKGDILIRQVGRTLHVVATCKPQTQAALRCTYQGIADMCDRLEKQEQHVGLDEQSTRDLKSVLFGPVIGIEAIRLIRADAVAAAVKMSSSLAKEIDGDVCALLESEVAPSVRDRLAAARLAR